MAVRLQGNLTIVSPPDLHPPHHDIISNRGEGEFIDTGSTTPYGERVYIRQEWVVDTARDLGLVPQAELDAVKAEFEEYKQREVEVREVLKEALSA